MAKIIGAIASSHTPTIGFGYEAWPLSPTQTAAAREPDLRRYADTIKRLNLQPDRRP